MCIYVSIPISRFLPPSSPSFLHMFVVHMCVSISALQISSSRPFFYILHACVDVQYLSFSFWLTSLCVTVSRFIHISANGTISFLFGAEQYSTVRKGNGTPLQYSCLENPMDGGAWWAAVHGVAKTQTRLSNFTFTFHFHSLKKEMAPHSSVLAWRIPGTGEPGGLPSMGSHRLGHDWSDLAAAAAAGISSRKSEIPKEHFMQRWAR